MNFRVRRACLVAALAAGTSQPCWAQAPDTSAAVVPAAPAAYRPGRGGIGASTGGSQIVVDGDYSQGAQPRFAFTGTFRYVISQRLRWQIAPYYTWAAYKTGEPLPVVDPNFPTDDTKDRVLTQVVGGSAQLQYVIHSGSWYWHAGVGPGVYHVWVQNRRKVLADPVSFERFRKVYPGASLEFGAQRFLKALPNTSIEAAVGSHFVLSDDPESFPSAFNSNLGLVELRIGANYYFDFGARRAAKPAAADQP